jgi:hypothetical protein
MKRTGKQNESEKRRRKNIEFNVQSNDEDLSMDINVFS